MGELKKCIQTSVLLVLCQSQYFYFLCTMTVVKSKIVDDSKLNQNKANFTVWKNEIKLVLIQDFVSNDNSNNINKKTGNYHKSDQDNLVDTKHSNKTKKPKSKTISKSEEEYVICKDILSMDSSSNIRQEYLQIVIPLNVINITSLGILFILILFGSYYVWKIMTRQKCSCKICKNEYKIMEKLGEGGFGEIYKVNKNSENLILKRCRTEDITEADDILIEAKHLRNLEHKNIVKYIDDFIHVEINKSKIDPTYYVIIIMEFCECGDLKNLVDENFYNNKTFRSNEILDISIQLCEGLNYLHNREIIHRDIKSQNIFLTKNNNLRIGDFGLAKKLKKNKRNSYMTKVGTDCYMAPEVLQGEIYGKPADVWSLGCVLHEMCTLNFMWMHDVSIGLSALTKKDYKDSFLDMVSESEHAFFKDEILRHIFVANPDKRIKIDTLLKKLKKEKSILNNKNYKKVS